MFEQFICVRKLHAYRQIPQKGSLDVFYLTTISCSQYQFLPVVEIYLLSSELLASTPRCPHICPDHDRFANEPGERVKSFREVVCFFLFVFDVYFLSLVLYSDIASQSRFVQNNHSSQENTWRYLSRGSFCHLRLFTRYSSSRSQIRLECISRFKQANMEDPAFRKRVFDLEWNALQLVTGRGVLYWGLRKR